VLRESSDREGGAIATELEYLDRGKNDSGLPKLLESADVYLWMPFRTSAKQVPPAKRRRSVSGSTPEVRIRDTFPLGQGSVLADAFPRAIRQLTTSYTKKRSRHDYKALAAAQDVGHKAPCALAPFASRSGWNRHHVSAREAARQQAGW